MTEIDLAAHYQDGKLPEIIVMDQKGQEHMLNLSDGARLEIAQHAHLDRDLKDGNLVFDADSLQDQLQFSDAFSTTTIREIDEGYRQAGIDISVPDGAEENNQFIPTADFKPSP